MRGSWDGSVRVLWRCFWCRGRRCGRRLRNIARSGRCEYENWHSRKLVKRDLCGSGFVLGI